jgi:hypothetical protein
MHLFFDDTLFLYLYKKKDKYKLSLLFCTCNTGLLKFCKYHVFMEYINVRQNRRGNQERTNRWHNQDMINNTVVTRKIIKSNCCSPNTMQIAQY